MTVLSQPVVSVFKPGTFRVVLRMVSECTAAKMAGVTNGAIVIHTQRLKSDPGGNLLS